MRQLQRVMAAGCLDNIDSHSLIFSLHKSLYFLSLLLFSLHPVMIKSCMEDTVSSLTTGAVMCASHQETKLSYFSTFYTVKC